MSRSSLLALKGALDADDPRLLQWATTFPPPSRCVETWPVEAACALGYCGWKGEELDTVAEVEEFFACLCCNIDMRMGESGGCRWFLNWFDETPRHEMRRLLLHEVNSSLAALEEKEAVA